MINSKKKYQWKNYLFEEQFYNHFFLKKIKVQASETKIVIKIIIKNANGLCAKGRSIFIP